MNDCQEMKRTENNGTGNGEKNAVWAKNASNAQFTYNQSNRGGLWTKQDSKPMMRDGVIGGGSMRNRFRGKKSKRSNYYILVMCAS